MSRNNTIGPFMIQTMLMRLTEKEIFTISYL